MSARFAAIVRGAGVVRRALMGLEVALVCLLLLAMVGVSALRIVVRVAHWELNLMWAGAFLKHSVLWLTVLGAALATRDRNHINIDVVGRLLKGRWRSGCLTLTNAFAAVVCVWAAWACYQFVGSQRDAFLNKSYDSAGTLFANVPAWYGQAIMPLAFALIALRFALHTIEDAAAVWTGRPSPTAPGRLSESADEAGAAP